MITLGFLINSVRVIILLIRSHHLYTASICLFFCDVYFHCYCDNKHCNREGKNECGDLACFCGTLHPLSVDRRELPLPYDIPACLAHTKYH